MDSAAIRALASFVAAHAEELAACLSRASVGVGVKDTPPTMALPEVASLLVPGAEVRVEFSQPQYSTPATFRGTVGEVIAGDEFSVTVVRSGLPDGTIILRWSCGRWASPHLMSAYDISIEVLPQESKR